ncbi:MAG: hypothetical protein V1908_01195 [Candidatus Peregrinibacteria bacterium]
MRNAPQSSLSQSFYAAIFAILAAMPSISCGGHSSAAEREAMQIDPERSAECVSGRTKVLDALRDLGDLVAQRKCRRARRVLTNVQRFADETAVACGERGASIARSALAGAENTMKDCPKTPTGSSE